MIHAGTAGERSSAAVTILAWAAGCNVRSRFSDRCAPVVTRGASGRYTRVVHAGTTEPAATTMAGLTWCVGGDMCWRLATGASAIVAIAATSWCSPEATGNMARLARHSAMRTGQWESSREMIEARARLLSLKRMLDYKRPNKTDAQAQQEQSK